MNGGGGGAPAVEFDSFENIDDIDFDFMVEDESQVLKVHEALETLSQENPELVAVVECRFFAGLTESQTAEALGVSERTVQRRWNLARAWLKNEFET